MAERTRQRRAALPSIAGPRSISDAVFVIEDACREQLLQNGSPRGRVTPRRSLGNIVKLRRQPDYGHQPSPVAGTQRRKSYVFPRRERVYRVVHSSVVLSQGRKTCKPLGSIATRKHGKRSDALWCPTAVQLARYTEARDHGI